MTEVLVLKYKLILIYNEHIVRYLEILYGHEKHDQHPNIMKMTLKTMVSKLPTASLQTSQQEAVVKLTTYLSAITN